MTAPTLHHVTCPDAAGGHRMAWWQWGDARAPHLVVCAHGLSRQGRDFDVLARALLARAAGQGRPLRVACPDVAGRGESDWLPDPMGYQFPTYAADMLAMLGALHRQAAIGPLDWVGTSMGGLIGLTLAGAPGLPLPAPIRRLVLNDVGPAIEWAALARIGQYLGKAGTFATVEEAAAALRAVSQGFGPHTDAEWMALSRPMLRALPEGGWRLHYDPAIAVPYATMTREATAQGEAALWQLYDQVRAETLVLRGADSDLLSAATAAAMGERGPRAAVVEFAGVGHAPTLVAADQVRAVLDFLLPSERGAALS
ncbi:MAG: alpha/beta hydrolase [Ottowia sp.]|uniref:alpha/beta fold hydrolase n=1 Tax=Ottowia sp. TaxID=1898956 RepID=UPI0039E4ED9D